MEEYKEKTGSRFYFLDVLRAAAVCAVVLLHTVTGVMDTTDMSGYPGQKTVFLVMLDLITWCVPVFVIISGFLFLRPDRKIGFRDIIGKYCRRILLALYLFGAPYACLELIIIQGQFRPEMLGQAFLMVLQGKSWSHMWYLYLILFLYLFTPLLKWLLSALPFWAYCALMGLLVLGSSLLPFLRRLSDMAGWGMPEIPVLPDAGIYLFYYLCGYLFAVKGNDFKNDNTLNENTLKQSTLNESTPIEKRRLPPWLLPAGIGALCAGMIVSRLAGGYTVQMAYNYPPTVVLALLLVCEARRLEPFWKARTGQRLRRFAAVSFTVYLIHPVCLNFFYKFIHLTPLSFPLALSLPFFFGVTLLFSAAGAAVLRKIPPLRRYVL